MMFACSHLCDLISTRESCDTDHFENTIMKVIFVHTFEEQIGLSVIHLNSIAHNKSHFVL